MGVGYFTEPFRVTTAYTATIVYTVCVQQLSLAAALNHFLFRAAHKE